MRVALKPLLWGGPLASTLLIAACGQSAPTAAPAAAPTAAPAAPVAADTARRAPIQQSLAYSGDIRAREQVSVLPKSTGRVDRLLVDVGSHVQAGDTLAVLEQDSAQINVLQARAALGGSNAADLEAAQAQVDTLTAQVQAGQAAVSSADAALNNLQGSSVADLQQAQSAYDTALAQLSAAQAALDQANNPTQAQIAQAEAALAQAQAARSQAQAQQTALEKNATAPCASSLLAPRNGDACASAKAAADTAVTSAEAGGEAAQ